jgi:3,2-trans-enoyl-CoA isomerase
MALAEAEGGLTMGFIDSSREGEVAVITLHRGKVNALNRVIIEDLHLRLESAAADESVTALVLTGHGKFFSFGLDVPELYDLPSEDFTSFVRSFTGIYTLLYAYPKPVIAALNGHAIAGGCMLALAGDRRLMAGGKGKIGLNEITFGSSVFAGSVEMLRALVGERSAERILLSGRMFEADQALALGLVDRVVPAMDLMPMAVEEARVMGSLDEAAFQSIKHLLRGPILGIMRESESDSIEQFVRIWYSESTRRHLKRIEIRRD